jgi:hypothetical protein
MCPVSLVVVIISCCCVVVCSPCGSIIPWSGNFRRPWRPIKIAGSCRAKFRPSRSDGIGWQCLCRFDLVRLFDWITEVREIGLFGALLFREFTKGGHKDARVITDMLTQMTLPPAIIEAFVKVREAEKLTTWLPC